VSLPQVEPGSERLEVDAGERGGRAAERVASEIDRANAPPVPDPDLRGGDATSRQPGSHPGHLERVVELVRFLRANCPWDAEQTPRSLVPYLLEEAHEVADAIEDGDDAELARELGDLLLNVAFQIVLAEERGAFTASDPVALVHSKMRRRHPHLYGDGEPLTWERMKSAERGGASVLAGLPRGLDPLSRAFRIQDRVSSVGFDWADAAGALEKVAEELAEVREEIAQAGNGGEDGRQALEMELGDLLFAVVNLSRLAGVHPTSALHRANRKFTNRFTALEKLAAERGLALEEASLAELDALWDEIKASE